MKFGVFVNGVLILVFVSIANSCPNYSTVIRKSDVLHAVYASRQIFSNGNKAGTRISNTPYKFIHLIQRQFFNQGDSIRVGIADDGNNRIIVFRGSQGIEQILRIGSSVLRGSQQITLGSQNVEVVSFFNQALELVMKDLSPYLKNGRKRYILTGHSLGGALASLLALKTRFYYGAVWRSSKSSLITFGQPRVGNAAYADLHDQMVPKFRKLRFVYKSDPITKLPNALFAGFRHHSRGVYLGSAARFRSSQPLVQFCYPGESLSCVNRGESIIPNFNHHEIDAYLNTLKATGIQYRTAGGIKSASFEQTLIMTCQGK
uniref:Fungal lipase-type domain-containing protein n=1 Tax=Clytia hemisphaerica TaxID=252671 RepID=A0A7M5WIQ9_9CNID